MQVLKNEDIKISSDRVLNIATGDSRFSVKWKNQEITWQWLVNKLQKTTRTRETIQEYQRMAKSKKDDIKDVGGFVGGILKEGRRKTENVANRSVITLDMDDIPTSVHDVWLSITMTYENALCIYSTHSHTEKRPRLRLVIPLSRPVFPDEYQAISRRIANDIGIDWFDDTTYEPARLMYWPSTSEDGEYVFKYQDGSYLDPDTVLNTYLDWTDVSLWPTSSRAHDIMVSRIGKQEDPLEKSGIVGAFCRTYSISDVIDSFLGDVYVQSKLAGRYTFKDGSTTSGLVTYGDKFAYSHHGTDPSSGILCNSFDLARIHLYGELDDDVKEGTPTNRIPSFSKMIKLAQEDPKVKIQLGKENLQDLNEEFDYIDDIKEEEEWLTKLEYDKKGNLENTIRNVMLVLENDPRIKGKLIYDEFANRAFVKKGAPWSDLGNHDWSDTDDSGLRYFMERHYQLTTAYKIEDAKNLTFDKCKTHPVREYLNSLVWDGLERLETVFVDYLGAEDSIYTREVAKVHLVGAVARIFRPGVKYDTMVTLTGKQGIGKSTFIAKLAMDWFSDNLDTMRGKEAAELIQGKWHIELGELNATRKADRDQVKAFLSRQEDVYRVAYSRNTSRFPRQCVFWGSTNDTAFLRDPTGDRRTYPIDCHYQLPELSIWDDLTQEEVDQIWAEAVSLYKAGTPIYLKGKAAEMVIEKQQEYKEDTPLRGLIIEYLESDYPIEWDTMDLIERRLYIQAADKDDIPGMALSGEKISKDKVCALEIWCELLGKKEGDLKPINTREINDILTSIKGWEKTKSASRFGNLYGSQRGFQREWMK